MKTINTRSGNFYISGLGLADGTNNISGISGLTVISVSTFLSKYGAFKM